MILGGINADTVWLFAAWVLCYCVQFSAARWFKSRFARRWMPPTIVYSAALCVVGLPFVIMRPGALRWAPSFVVLARLSFLAAWLRRERSLWGNDGRNR